MREQSRPEGKRLKGEVARVCAKRRLGKVEAMFQLAVAEAKRARWGRRTRRREVRMYYCGHCRAYHTTSKNNWGNDGSKRLAAIWREILWNDLPFSCSRPGVITAP